MVRREARAPLPNKLRKCVLFPSHSYVRKAYELYFALLMEAMWSKERILEVYLNVVEFGPGIYGAEAAAQNYFGVSAKQLEVASSAFSRGVAKPISNQSLSTK